MKHLPPIISLSPLPYVLAMMNPFVGGGILLLVLSLLIRMALLSVADLSYVVPMTASGYILSTILGKMFLQESVSWEGWIGTVLVFLGSSLVGLTPGKTTVATKNQ